jgi:hypothetical protein
MAPAGTADAEASSSNATLPCGKATPQPAPTAALPKQHPAAKQPRRPKACPTASDGTPMSPTIQNDQR